MILSMLAHRFKEVGLEMHPDKSHIVYCKDVNRRLQFKKTSFTFLGFDFCPRESRNSKGEKFLNFSAAASKTAIKNMKAQIRRWHLHLRNEWNINQIANCINPILRGWYQYYGKFYKTALRWVWRNLNHYLCRWVMQKYKRYKRYKAKAGSYLTKIALAKRELFFHWQLGYY